VTLGRTIGGADALCRSVSGFLTPWYGARWHRSRRASDQGENITGAPTLKAAKAACERHAASRAEQG
jgi:hypothetical protein